MHQQDTLTLIGRVQRNNSKIKKSTIDLDLIKVLI
jgi:hypothetical protein